jgi:2-polyprenyl-3-methyl-5-hydroxy-6-metoxy-1,4-benzoquinol methylase
MTTLLKTRDGIFCCDILDNCIRVYEADDEEAIEVASQYARKHNLQIRYAAYNVTGDFHQFNIIRL